jgi:cellulose synthase/poly-beta-1,6-N-acetylglucosamine synthase-like glycosyltransferase
MVLLGYILIGIGLFTLLYIYILYGLIIKIWAALFEKKVLKNPQFQPDITIVIAAHNEEKLIEKSVRSIFNSNYPKERIKVLIGSDGSTDKTYEICKKLSEEYSHINVYEFTRGGKNLTLNKLTTLVESDFICFMDADILVQPETIKIMMSNFADQEVGAVISPQFYIDDNPNEVNTGHIGELTYQNYESQIRHSESKIFGTVNNIGPFYIVRREFYQSLPNEKICDDFTSILNVNIAKKRVIYEAKTNVLEFRKKSLGNELDRRVRMVSGGLESIELAKELFTFRHFRTGFFLFSHKLLRFLSPYFFILIILGTIILWNTNIYIDILFYSELVLFSIVLVGFMFNKFKIKVTPFQYAVYFFTMNYGFLKGISTYLKNQSSSKW